MKYQVTLKSYEPSLLNESYKRLQIFFGQRGVESNCIPLPTKIKRVTVLRSPHVNKTSREQFEIKTHKRLININLDNITINPDSINIDYIFENIQEYIPSGVFLKIKIFS